MFDINANEFMANVAKEIIKDTIKSAWDKVKGFFVDLNAKESIEYGRAYEKYIENTEIKYGKIKTLIYRRMPKDLYSFYECVGVNYNGRNIDTSSVNNLFQDENKIIITGTGGVGKSILCKHLFLNTIKETCLIPVIVELRSINSIDNRSISLFDIVYNSLVDNGFNLAKKYFEYSMAKGAYIVLLDGYDEVNRENLAAATKQIKDLCSKYNSNKYLVSSRPTDGFIGWNDFAEMEALVLTKEQAISLIDKTEFDASVKTVFSKELDKSLYDKYESFASNPLLLNIMLLTFSNNASIPDRLSDFYELAFTTLFNEHDATKDAYVRDIRTGLSCIDFKLLFSHICFKSYFKHEFEFSESRLYEYIKDAKEKLNINKFRTEDFQDDLIQSVCMLVKDGVNYRFSHTSFQEYFSAFYTCKLTDDIQKRILADLIKNSSSLSYDSYFDMLFNLQSDKVNKLILCPAIKKLQAEYIKHGFTIELLDALIKSVVAMKLFPSDKNSKVCFLYFSFKNDYYYRIINLALKLNNYNNSIVNSMFNLNSQSAAKLLLSEIGESNPGVMQCSLGEAIRIVGKEQLLQGYEWFNEDLLLAFSILEKYAGKPDGGKRNTAAIIDEL